MIRQKILREYPKPNITVGIHCTLEDLYHIQLQLKNNFADKTGNKYNKNEDLEMVNEDSATDSKPPPIILPDVNDISEMLAYLNSKIKRELNDYKTQRNGHVRVMVKSIEEFRKLVKTLSSRATKTPLNMFYVDIEPNNKNRDNVKHIGNAIVNIEPPRKNNEIVRCLPEKYRTTSKMSQLLRRTRRQLQRV